MRSFILFALLLSAVSLVYSRDALAAPEAHVLRIDPRAGLQDGKPVLTTVIEIVQFKRLSDALQPCAGVTGAGPLACWSGQLEKPGARCDPFPLPQHKA